MPYISQVDRTQLRDRRPRTPGELNYVITLLVKDYVELKGLSYTVLNDVVGALEACKLEFYRREVAKYEDRKIAENGDVY